MEYTHETLAALAKKLADGEVLYRDDNYHDLLDAHASAWEKQLEAVKAREETKDGKI